MVIHNFVFPCGRGEAVANGKQYIFLPSGKTIGEKRTIFMNFIVVKLCLVITHSYNKMHWGINGTCPRITPAMSQNYPNPRGKHGTCTLFV